MELDSWNLPRGFGKGKDSVRTSRAPTAFESDERALRGLDAV